MTEISQSPRLGLEAALSTERARLVRLCAYLSREPAVAEDLAQETLLEAWRLRGKLRDHEAIGPWLSAVARYVCLRRARRKSKECEFTVTLDGEYPWTNLQYELADEVDLELELERCELAELLHRAMDLLPAETRQILIARYVEDRPQVEAAVRLGLSDGAAAMRLQRGRRALLRILQTNFGDDFQCYGFAITDREEWQATRIWCPLCGLGRLSVLRSPQRRTFVARCSACRAETNDTGGADYLQKVHGPWRTLLRSHGEAHAYFSAALSTGNAPCSRCGRGVPLRPSLPQGLPGIPPGSPGVHVRCRGCAAVSFQTGLGLALTTPQVQRFWRRHRRIQTLPLREIDVAEQPALLARFESQTDTVAVDVIMLRDSLEVVGTYGANDKEVA